MSDGTVVLMVAAGWLAVGLVLAVVMGRRGHDTVPWLALGALFGPLGTIFALEAWRDERIRPVVVAGRAATGPGPVDVLVGSDGSPEAQAALAAVADLFGPRLGRLTLATVVPYDGDPDAERVARAALEGDGAGLGRPARLEILHGRPSQALMDRAVGDRYDLLVIGARGRGVADALLGSTAADITRSASLPVLLMGARRVVPAERPLEGLRGR